MRKGAVDYLPIHADAARTKNLVNRIKSIAGMTEEIQSSVK